MNPDIALPPKPTSPVDLPPGVSSGITPPRRHARLLTILISVVVMLLVVIAVLAWLLLRDKQAKVAPATAAPASSQTATTQTAQGLQLDTAKQYGNKYADDILPVGDGKYSTTAAQKGSVYACSQYAQNLSSGSGGAQVRGG